MDKFKENVDNHNINKPVIIVPLDINLSVSEEKRANQILVYRNLVDKVKEYNKVIHDIYKLKKDLNKGDADIKKTKSQIKYREKIVSKLDSEIKSVGVIINDETKSE